MNNDVVVGYDGSDCAKAALDAAAGLAKDLGGQVVIVFGFEPPYVAAGEVSDHRSMLRELGDRLTREGAQRAQAAGVEVDAVLVDEDPAEALVDVAKQRQARCIVVGTYGEHPLKGMILGSTPYRLVHSAEFPVLVVPAE